MAEIVIVSMQRCNHDNRSVSVFRFVGFPQKKRTQASELVSHFRLSFVLSLPRLLILQFFFRFTHYTAMLDCELVFLRLEKQNNPGVVDVVVC